MTFWFQLLMTGGKARSSLKAVMRNDESETQPMNTSMTSLTPTIFWGHLAVYGTMEELPPRRAIKI